MLPQTVKIEAGHVFLPEKASWLSDFKDEVLQFPNGKFDDQIDSMSQFLGWVRPSQNRLISAGGQRIVTRNGPRLSDILWT